MPWFRPSPEQEAAVAAFAAGNHVVLQPYRVQQVDRPGGGAEVPAQRRVRQHVPRLKGIGEQHLHDQLAELVLPFAQRMWEDLQNPDPGRVKFRHDNPFSIARWRTGPVTRSPSLP
jgi:hypothetical protein